MPDAAVKVEPDEFEQAFAQISALDNKTEKQTVVDKPTPGAADAKTAADAAVVVDQKVAADAGKGADAAAVTGDAVAANATKTAEELAAEAKAAEDAAKVAADKAAADSALDAEFKKRFTSVLKDVVDPNAAARAQQEAAVRAAAQQQAQIPAFTKEESEFLQQVEADFPDLIRAGYMQRQLEYKHLLNHVFNEVGKSFEPVVNLVRNLAERVHMTDLYGAIPDYDVTRPMVVEWAKKQPDYLRIAYENIIQSGTQEQVVDMVNRFRKEHPTQAAAEAATSGQTVAAGSGGVRTQAKQPDPKIAAAAAALTAVPGKRTGAVTTEPVDYDNAFEAAMKSLKDDKF